MKKVILVGLMFVVFFGWKDIVSADSVTEENAVISEVKELEREMMYLGGKNYLWKNSRAHAFILYIFYKTFYKPF